MVQVSKGKEKKFKSAPSDVIWKCSISGSNAPVQS